MGATSRIERDISSLATIHQPRVFILSDVRLLREGLTMLLSAEPAVVVVGSAAASEAGSRIAELQSDIVLVDATMRELRACVHRVRGAASGIKIVAFALGELDEELIACAEAGISAFVGRNGSHRDLVCAIEQTWRGEFPLSPHQARLLLGRIAELAETGSPLSSANLTRREQEILPLIERGLSNKEIARQLSIETATIKNHVHNILEKMQARRRGEVAARIRSTAR
jgi:DNA-binding NarL/FixJ family response regulator